MGGGRRWAPRTADSMGLARPLQVEHETLGIG